MLEISETTYTTKLAQRYKRVQRLILRAYAEIYYAYIIFGYFELVTKSFAAAYSVLYVWTKKYLESFHEYNKSASIVAKQNSKADPLDNFLSQMI